MRSNLNTLRALATREDNLLNARSNLFFLWQSILMASVVAGGTARTFTLLICGLGMVSILIWVYIGNYNRKVAGEYLRQVEELEATLPPDDQIYTNAQNFRRSIRWRGLSIYRCMVFLFPGLWGSIWILVIYLKAWNA